MKKILLFCIGTLISLISTAQRDFSQVTIKPHKITDQIYMLEGSGGNIGLYVGEDGVIIIDSQYAPLSEKITDAIRTISDQPIKYLLNTHWHGDHTGGNVNFENKGAVIIAHENVKTRLSTEQYNKAFQRTTPPAPQAAWPQITYNEEMKVHFNGESIMLLHVHNAHTDGDTFVWFPESNVLHTGDCFFNQRFPYIDLGSGGSIDGIIRATQTALLLVDDETTIIPGHGNIATKADLLAYHNMLNTMRDRVKKAIAAGQTIEEMKAASLDEGYEAWGEAFISGERIVDIIWTDLSRKD